MTSQRLPGRLLAVEGLNLPLVDVESYHSAPPTVIARQAIGDSQQVGPLAPDVGVTMPCLPGAAEHLLQQILGQGTIAHQTYQVSQHAGSVIVDPPRDELSLVCLLSGFVHRHK
jgi:hypothetical protein